MSVIARTGVVLQTVLLTVAPSGGQRTARQNALAAANRATTARSQRAEAFAAFNRVSGTETQPAAS